MEAGLDSLGAVELRASLEAAFGLVLPRTVTIDYPTSSALAAHIDTLLTSQKAVAGAFAVLLMQPLLGQPLLMQPMFA